MRSVSRIRSVVFGLLLVLAVYVLTAPYIAAFRLKWAAENYGGTEVSEFVDFESFHQSLKDEYQAEMAEKMAADKGPSAIFGSAMTGAAMDAALDLFITPANIAKVIAAPHLSAGDFLASMGYDSLDRFSATIPNGDGTNYVDLIFHRRGIEWKLTMISNRGPGPVKPRWPWNWK